MGAPLWPIAYCSDLADKGYAPIETKATPAEFREAMQWRERWHFRDFPRPSDVTHGTAAQLDLDGGLLGVGGLDPEFETLGFGDTAVRGGAPSGIGPR